MPNYLLHENSPYLLQHADNPVDWYPWSAEALDKACAEQKPIFLSIGYAACHWCHVMAHESFEDPETAALMNEHFINIKVDREERPDLDSIYMSAVVAMTGQGGWPMSVFLTPDGQPFFGGTYYPPKRRYNMPSFQEVLTTVARLWRQDRGKILKAGHDIAEHIRGNISPGSRQTTLNPENLIQASRILAQSYNWQDGGWGQAPKFPQPMTIEFLLGRAVTDQDISALEIAVHALRAMAKGGMYDVVGGGFARYSTDDQWLTPHFEKMLYDNAQLALAYLHGYLVCRENEEPAQAGGTLSFARFAPALRQVCEETLDFVLREMTDPAGGFYSSLDADSEGEEGKFYLWSATEISQVLGPERAVVFKAAYGVTAEGNFEGRNILQRQLEDGSLAERYNLPLEAVANRLKQDHTDLLTARGKRVRPATDDKVLVAWNGLMLAAFAEAARYLQRPDYLVAAQRNARFLLTELRPSGQLLRSWRQGKAQHNAYLEDYAALILGLLALYQSDPDPSWFMAARQLTAEMVAHFQDPSGGFFDTRDDHEDLIIRPKDLQDNATPSGSSLAATALLHMAAYTGNGAWRDLAESALLGIQDAVRRYPTAFARWLSALHFARGPVQEVAILGQPGEDARQHLVEALWSTYHPNLAAAISDYPPPNGPPELLADRPLLNGQATAYVCQGFVCQQPVNSPEALVKQLR